MSRAAPFGARQAALHQALEALTQQTDAVARMAADPIHFPHRYAAPADQEIAAAIAGGLAYGRVAAFWPVVEAVLARADAAGGPAAWVRGFDRKDAVGMGDLQYRWMRGPDIALWCATLGAALRRHGRLGSVFEAGWRPEHRDVGPALDHAITQLRDLAVGEARRLGGTPSDFAALPRGFRYFLPQPSGGSACKRWCMVLRWMVRPPGDPTRVDGIDLGLWQLPARALVMPLDTHVRRLSWFLGLTERQDGSWRTAREVTAGLARLDPEDPLRFDFALAHLGISGSCTVARAADQAPPLEVCRACALAPSCRIGAPRLNSETG